MADFDLIKCGYNTADETINFGSRAISNTPYEASTLATIRSHEGTSESPTIRCMARNDQIYLTVNNSLKIFKDKDCSELIYNVVFDSVVDTFSVSTGTEYILVCLRNGSVHVIHGIDGEYNCVFSRNMNLPDDDEGQQWCHDTLESGDFQFLVVSNQGLVQRVIIDPLDAPNVVIEEVHDFNTLVETAAFSHPLLLVNGAELSVLDLETGALSCQQGKRLKRLFPMGFMFFGLDFEGGLFRICPVTLLFFAVRNETLYKDILVNNAGCKTFIMVTKEDETGHSFIQSLSYPDFSVSYSLELVGNVYLVSPESVFDETMYISEIIEDNLVKELRLQVIYETEPYERLQRLLRKRQFAEAEIFARTFKLDLMPVRKAKARVIVEKKLCESSDIDQFFQLLDEIDDVEFKLRSCIDIVTFSSCNLQDVHRVLKYGCAAISTKTKNSSVIKLEETIASLMYRFETFMAVNRGQLNGLDWNQFGKCDLLKEVKRYLKNGSIEKAIIIYNRLQGSATTLTNSEVKKILGELDKLPSDVYPAFLQTFVPITCTVLPSSLQLFVQWIQRKVFHMELNSRPEFPDNAIRFIETMVGLLTGFAVYNEGEMHSIISGLNTLKVLKEEYKIALPLEEYLSGPQSVVSYLLNVKMCPEDYGSLLGNFLLQFILQNQMEPNKVFLLEIATLVKSKENNWKNIVGPILNCITSIQTKVEAILIILRSAPVPWSDSVRNLAQSALKYDHSLVAPVEEFIKREPILIVLSRPEYEITERRIVNLRDFKFFVNRILYCNLPTMMEDVYQLCITPQHKHEANLMLIIKFIRNCDVDSAVQVFSNNPPEERVTLGKELSQLLEPFATRPEFSHLREHCHGFLCLILNKVDQESTMEAKFARTRIVLLRDMLNVKKNFDLDVTMRDLYKNGGKAEVADKLIDLESSNFDETDIQLFRICDTISSSLSDRRDTIMLKFCGIINNYRTILNAGEILLEHSFCTENLCLMAVLLLKFLNVNPQVQNTTFFDPNCTVFPESDSAQLYEGLMLAERIATKALINAEPADVESCMEVVNWTNTAFYMSHGPENTLRTFLFGDVHHCSSMLSNYSTFEMVNRIFTIYNNFIGQFSNTNKYLTHFKPDDDLSVDELQEELQVLPAFIRSLNSDGQQFTAYKIVETLEKYLRCIPSSNPAVEYLNTIRIKQCIPRTLEALLINNSIDSKLFYNLLLDCDQEDAVKFVLDKVRMYKRQPDKFVCLAGIALKLLKRYNMRGRTALQEAILAVKWWKKFEQHLNYDTFCKSPAEKRLDMLFDLDDIDVKLITNYCADFRLELQRQLLRFFKRTLCNWKPHYSIQTKLGCKSIVIKSNEDELYEECLDIISVIDDKEEILTSISALWNTLNYYHYEVFIALLRIVSSINSNIDNTRKVLMLVFLKNYQRISLPSEIEIEQWYSTFPDTQSVDVLSQFRLPFTNSLLTSEIWTIIRPEITLKTYKFWFGAISILNAHLNKDGICSYAIKDVVASGVLKSSDSHWTLYPKHETLFQEIYECVQNMDDLEMCTSVFYHLMAHTPNGADLVTATSLCYRFAKKYRSTKPGLPDVEQAVTKIEKKYYNFSATHILYRYQLNDEKYINLVTTPSELIAALYLDERIVKNTFSLDHLCPDINKAVDELAELFSLKIGTIRNQLVEKWLANNAVSDFNVSLVSPDQDEDNLKRASYVCCADRKNLMTMQSYLLSIGLRDDTEEEEKTDISKAKALKLFALVTDDETILELTGLTRTEFMITIDKLILIDNLQYLGFSLDTKSLDGYNKKELLKRLAQRSKNSLAIKTMAVICTTYNIFNTKYWEFIVNNAVQLSMFPELKRYLELQPITARYQRFYVNAWQKLIEQLFSSLSEGDVTEDLINNFRMIQSCPVVFSLNLKYCFKKCLSIGKEEFAAVLLQYFDNEVRIQLFEEIVATKKDVIKKLDTLSMHGICGIPFVKLLF